MYTQDIVGFTTSNKVAYISIPKEELNSFDGIGTQEWITNNPFMIKYELEIPEFIPLSNSQQININTFLGKTHIFSQVENGVSPTIKIIVDRINKLSREGVEKAKVEPTSKNISLTRMWVNQMGESVLKDQLQEQLNQLFGSDIVLDRKNITSNIDVYVKSENSLHMTLSTNNITFEQKNSYAVPFYSFAEGKI